LNHEPVRRLYGSGLSKLDIEPKEIIMSILKSIKKEEPATFGDPVDDVLKGL
jgi:hypothetical protein